MMFMATRPLRVRTFLYALLLATPTLLAANVPDQELIRQQERENALRQQQEQTPNVRLEQPASVELEARLPVGERPCFVIQHVALTGEASERFQWLLSKADRPGDPVIGKCLGSKGINLVMKRMQNALIDRGFITSRVLAAPQDLKQGQLVLTFVPGRIHAIRFATGTSNRAAQWNAMPVKVGDILNVRDIEQGLENFKRVPTADADIKIEPATGSDTHPGDSDLLIQWQQAFPFRLSLSLDDGGSRATGRYQGGVTVSYDNWWTLNDLFYFSANHSVLTPDGPAKGAEGYTAHYELPLGYWLLGATASQSRYHQSVPGQNQTYVYSGDSSNSELKLSRVLYRDAQRKTGGYVLGWARESRNYIDDTEVQIQHRRMAGWEAGLTHREYLGSGTLDARLAYRQGTGALAALPAPEQAFDEGTSRLQLISADAQFTQPFSMLGGNWRYLASWRAQWNRTPLVPQDRFAIGGRYTVRGFDGENSLIAERGWLWRNDLGLALGPSGQELYLGLDYGAVGGASANTLLGKRLMGAVVGLRGSYKGLGYDLFAGVPIKKPDGFTTSPVSTGFQANWTW